jgi:hypothetical protein
MDIPKLSLNRCSVIIAEYNTGIVCYKDLTYYQNGIKEDEVFQSFDSFLEAKEYVINFVAANPKFECTIFDHSGEPLFAYDLNGEQKFLKE